MPHIKRLWDDNPKAYSPYKFCKQMSWDAILVAQASCGYPISLMFLPSRVGLM